MLRLLLLIALGWLLWRAFSRALAPPRPPRDAGDYEAMARCARCGTFVPRSDLDRDDHCQRCRGA